MPIGTIANVLQTIPQSVSRLEAEVLLAHLLQVARSHLHAYPEKKLTQIEINAFQALLQEKADGMPVAYLIGRREFWSLDLRVTHKTLIPRPETELLVERVLAEIKGEQRVIADLGTGSGAIALALAHERPSWTVYATDICADALQVAKENAARLNLTNVQFYQGSWCDALPMEKMAAIVSNPPYLATNDIHLKQGDLRYEPESALIAGEDGLLAFRQIIKQAKSYLQLGGYLVLEHGFQQGSAVSAIFKQMGYDDVHLLKDLAGLDRVTYARMMITSENIKLREIVDGH